MRRVVLVAWLLAIWALAGCRPATAPPAAQAPTATTAATPLAPTLPPTGTSTPTFTAIMPPTGTPAPTLSPTHSPPPTHSPAAAPTPMPSSPPPQVPVAGEPLPLSLDWQFSSNGHLTAGGIAHLSGQPVFLAASLGRTVYALTEQGEVWWKAQTAGPVYALAILDGDRVAVGDDAGFVTLLDGRGRRLWRHDLGSRVMALCGGWSGGLLAGGWDERLSLMSQDGQVLWQVGVDGPVSGIAVTQNLALVAIAGGEVRAMDATGAEVWRFDAGAPVVALETVAEKEVAAVLAGVQDGRLLALSEDGTLLWQHMPGAVAAGSPIWHVADVWGETAPELVLGTGESEPVLTLLTIGGEVLWRVSLSSPVGAITSLDLDGDGAVEILVGLASGEVHAYDELGRHRGAVHAGLSVWGLEALDGSSAAPDTGGAVLILADVVAWRLTGGDGPAGGPWLSPPPMSPISPDVLPSGAERAEGEAILVFLGDVALGRTMEAQLARYGSAYPWGGVEPLLREADFAMANLEGVLTTRGKPLDKSYLLRAHPQWGQSLADAGFDLVTLANNHALDYGDVGLDDTLGVLNSLNVAVVGVGPSQSGAHDPALFTFNGVRVAILGYAAARWNGSVDVPATDRIAWAYPDDVQADVRSARDGADLVVVVLHAGTEYATAPSPDQVAVAHAAVDAGADLVVGHHAHVTQTVERYKQGLIVYGLGDALFDIPRSAAMRGHLLRVHATREGLARAEIWPFWIEDAIRPRLLDNGQGAPRFKIVYP